MAGLEPRSLYLALLAQRMNPPPLKIQEHGENIPTDYYLAQNYPNPFNLSTTIEFGLEDAGHVTLNIYDVNGRLVAQLLDNNLESGHYNYRIDRLPVSSGLYFYYLKTNSFSQTRKLTLMK